jgi:hypothetical protein
MKPLLDTHIHRHIAELAYQPIVPHGDKLTEMFDRESSPSQAIQVILKLVHHPPSMTCTGGRELLVVGWSFVQSQDMAAFVSYQVTQLGSMIGMVKDDMVGHISECYLNAGPVVVQVELLSPELKPLPGCLRYIVQQLD